MDVGCALRGTPPAAEAARALSKEGGFGRGAHVGCVGRGTPCGGNHPAARTYLRPILQSPPL
ncbi:MAG: hypothetical protein LBM98_10405 [Oscillospiraceae bacterium]|nr:hypothetical protein [Oscillospiraceae bacterium]